MLFLLFIYYTVPDCLQQFLCSCYFFGVRRTRTPVKKISFENMNNCAHWTGHRKVCSYLRISFEYSLFKGGPTVQVYPGVQGALRHRAVTPSHRSQSTLTTSLLKYFRCKLIRSSTNKTVLVCSWRMVGLSQGRLRQIRLLWSSLSSLLILMMPLREGYGPSRMQERMWMLCYELSNYPE